MTNTGDQAGDHDTAQVQAWLSQDPDPQDRRALARWLEDEPALVHAAFSGRVEFGTAGLRAPMGPGPTRMNRVVVRQTTTGLMRWLQRHIDRPRVVIGYDARHRSASFAADTAHVVALAGGEALLLPRPLPTPVLAAAVLHLGADAGVMVTASHNPAADNGYKLYLSNGIQLVSPADSEIAAEIDRVAQDGVDLIGVGQPDLAEPDQVAEVVDGVELLDETVVEHHRRLAASVRVAPDVDLSRVRVVYTAMHGVGGRQLLDVFDVVGAARPLVVADQFEPDPDFSTVPFPNPEEAGALDLAIARAAGVGDGEDPPAALFAHDPDADRLAVAVPARDGTGFVALSGDEVGVLLADHLLRHTSGARQVSTSVVSSRLLAAIAADHGVRCTTTPTGFKWVARPALWFPDHQLVLGYEEALGYSVGGRVRDKDGITAAVAMLELLAALDRAGETVWQSLDRLHRAFGVHLTAGLSVRFDSADPQALSGAALDRARTSPPVELNGSPLVEAVELVAQGEPLDNAGLPTTVGAGGLVLTYRDQTRVIIRPSGTEPKLKAYVEVIEPVEGADVDMARSRAEERLAVATSAVDGLLRAG